MDFHADDYALSPNSDRDIDYLLDKGFISSISIIPNMSRFDQASVSLKSLPVDIEKSVHLNFMEGKSCLEKERIPDLVDEDSCFKVSWGSLLCSSFNPAKRRRIRRQLSLEIVAQVEKCICAGVVDPYALRLDSHQHTHMIPVVQDALFDAATILEVHGRKIVFVRNAEEPLLLYFKTRGGLAGFSFINMIKCLILNLFSLSLRRRLKKRSLPIAYLCGVFYSGHMDMERLKKVLPEFQHLVKSQNCRAEILFHPGTVLESEISAEFTKPDFVQFHVSENRQVEFESICRLQELNI